MVPATPRGVGVLSSVHERGDGRGKGDGTGVSVGVKRAVPGDVGRRAMPQDCTEGYKGAETDPTEA